MNLKRYVTLARAGIIEAMQFRASFLIMVVGNLLYLIVVYYLWKAIYASSGSDVVNGMTFYDTLIYLVLATTLHGFMDMYVVWDMGRDIQSGKIVLDLLRPIDYRHFLIWSSTGFFIVRFFLTFLPTFIVVAIVTKGAIPLGLNLLIFPVSIIMSISINYSIDFIVGTICLYTESIWGINIMKEVVVLLLSGATIPLAFFPEAFRNAVYFLPFQAIYNAPLSILLSSNAISSDVAYTLLMQLFWSVAMLVISKLFWKVSLKQITVNGG